MFVCVYMFSEVWFSISSWLFPISMNFGKVTNSIYHHLFIILVQLSWNNLFLRTQDSA